MMYISQGSLETKETWNRQETESPPRASRESVALLTP